MSAHGRVNGSEVGSPPHALSRMATPQPGDRILVFRLHWLNLILAGEKDLEIRGRNLSGGRYWLGCRGTIFGRAILEAAIPITSAHNADWRAASAMEPPISPTP